MGTTPAEDSAPGGGNYGNAQVGGNKRWMRNYKLLDSQYSPWGALYKDLADYICLGRGRFPERENSNQKTKAALRVVNDTATNALHMLGAGQHGGMSSPARPWFKLGFVDPVMDRVRQYRSWLDDAEKGLYTVFKRQNFYNLIHNVYEEKAGFGTGCLFIEADPVNVVNFSYFTAGDYRFTVKPNGRTHCFYRYFRMQAAQLASEFGVDKTSDRVQNLLRNNPYEWVDMYHVIEPNDDYQPDLIDSKPWISVYFEAKEPEKRLSYGGYQECPVVTPRWQSLGNEAYGWGPGPETLGLVKALQKMELATFKASDKMLDPPSLYPPSFKDRMVDLTPGAKNVGDEVDGKVTPLVMINPAALGAYEQRIVAIEQRIRRSFYNDIFLMIASQPAGGDKMTAAEIVARNQEKMLMLGPVIESDQFEMLDPTIERVFALAARAGAIPPPPEDLANMQYKVDYVSIMAQAQKLLSTQGMGHYLSTAERVAMVDPASVSKTNWDRYLEETGDAVGLPAKILRDDKEMQQIREAANQQAAEERQAAQGMAGVDAMQKLGNTPMDENSVLGQMAQESGDE